MGGSGSGRHWYFGAKDATDDYRALDVRRWQRDGLLMPGGAFSWQWTRNGKTVASIHIRVESDCVILTYRHQRGSEAWKSEEYPVYLDRTPCTYGGARAWFRCPAQGCGRRVAILYGGTIFACRHCYRLAYPSQRKSDDDRAARRADRIRERLGWPVGILNPAGGKPKGMHWRTFWKLKEQHDTFVGVALTGMAKQLGLMNGRLASLRDDLPSER